MGLLYALCYQDVCPMGELCCKLQSNIPQSNCDEVCLSVFLLVPFRTELGMCCYVILTLFINILFAISSPSCYKVYCVCLVLICAYNLSLAVHYSICFLFIEKYDKLNNA